MSIRRWLETPRLRRGIAAGSIVLAAGGMVLLRSSAGARTPELPTSYGGRAGPNSSQFSGLGVRGTFSLSDNRVLASGEQRIFAELSLVADKAETARERAPISLAVVLDTSGSMQGEKIVQAKRSVVQLLRDMRDDDQIALVRYSLDYQLVQPLRQVGYVRRELIERVEAIEADGGTRISPALSQGLLALGDSSTDGVRRVVLVSDGLDNGDAESSRSRSESIARAGAERGITISSMGIGLDFDEAYMSSVAQLGHGNFAFVKDSTTLASFLRRELLEGTTTTVHSTTATLTLPEGVRLVRAVGAEALPRGDRELEFRIGSLFSGDERRIVLELAARMDAGDTGGFEGRLRWNRVGGGTAAVELLRLEIAGTKSQAEVDAGRDATVYANAMSAVASARQLDATRAYAAGDTTRAQALTDENMAEIEAAAIAAPAAARAMLSRQLKAYGAAKQGFSSDAPGSAAGKAHAKEAYAKDSENLVRKKF